MAKIRKTFTGGRQELDIENKLLPQNQYRYGQNITVTRSESSDVGSVQSIRGNKIPDTSFTSSSTGNVTIGIVTDNLNDRIYYAFVGPTREGWYEFDLRTNKNVRIIEFTRNRRILKFDPNSRIFGNVIGNLLYWTDNLNPPRKINLDRFRGTILDPEIDADGVSLISLDTRIITSSGNVLITSAFSSDLIGVAKRPPLFPPSIVNNSTQSNYGIAGTPLYESFISFSYRYKYRDGETTAMAPFSEPAFFPEDFSVSRGSGILQSMVNRYNSVDLKFDVGDIEVTEIELLLKESNSGAVYVMTTINKRELGYDFPGSGLTSSNPYQRTYSTFTYDANKVYRILPENELTRIYDNVPIKARAQTFVGNRLVYGNYTDSYPLTIDNANGDPVVIDFNLDVVSTFKNEEDMTPSKSVKSDRFYEAGIVYLDRFGRQTPVLTPKSSSQSRSNTVLVPFGTGGHRNQLTVEIFNKAPFWATHYRMFIKETKLPFYQIFPERAITDSDNSRIYLRIPSIDQHSTVDEISGIQSTLNKVNRDDIIVLKSRNNPSVNDVETQRREYRVVQVGFIDTDSVSVLSSETDGVFITVAPVVPSDLNEIPNNDATLIFESVPTDGNLDLYYEWGETFRCYNGIHTTSKEDIVRVTDPVQNIDIPEDPVGITLSWFNCYSYSNGVESMHVRDEFFGRAIEKGARASTVSEEYRERVRENFMIHSGVYNDDVNLNRLNEFNASLPITKEVEINEGSIQYLHPRNTNLVVFQEDKLKHVPINKNLIQTAGGNSQLTVDSTFFGVESPVLGNYGISQHPESFASYGQYLYWVDVNRGCACRLFTGNGQIEEISRFGLENVFRGDSRRAELIVGGYDEYHKRYLVTLRNKFNVGDFQNTTEIFLSSTGCPDPQAECQRNTSVIDFNRVFLSVAMQDLELQRGDVIFVDQDRTTHYNGNFRWFRIRDGEANNFTYDRVIQVSPDGIITSIVESCNVMYPTVADHRPFNISSEVFNDEFDCCENGIADSIAFVGNRLNDDGTQGDQLPVGSEPALGNQIFEGRADLVPSSRTGYFLITEGLGRSVVNLEEGVVIGKISCAEIELGRRRIQGSLALPILIESVFNRNLRLCRANTFALSYYFEGNKEIPQVGDTLYVSNIDNDVATASSYFTFENGYYVLLNASSEVIETGNCFTQQCTADIEDLFTQDASNLFEFTFDGVGESMDPLSGVTIEFAVIGDARYPSAGFFIQEVDEITVGQTLTLVPTESIAENVRVDVVIAKVCYRLNVVGEGILPLYRNATGVASDGASLCGTTVTEPIFLDNSNGRYYEDQLGETLFDGGNLLYGINETDGGNANNIFRIASDGSAVIEDTISCAFRYDHDLTFALYTDGLQENVNESCGLNTEPFFGDNEDFSSVGSNPTTTLRLGDGSGATPPDGVYSNKVVARRLEGGVLGSNLPSGCNLSAVGFTAFYDTVENGSIGACHISTTESTIFTNNDELSLETVGIYEEATLTTLAPDGFYSNRSQNFVVQWDSTTRKITFPSMGTCPGAPSLYVGEDAGFSATVNSSGVISATITDADATLLSFSPQSVVLSSGDHPVSGVIEVPQGYSNQGETVTATDTITAPEAPAVPGCTDSAANNYDPSANTDDGSCTYDPVVPGCTDPSANNYNPNATTDDGSCTFGPIMGCTDSAANNYNPNAEQNDGSCTYDPPNEDTFTTSDANFSVSVGSGETQAITASVSEGTIVANSVSPTSISCGTGSHTVSASVTVPATNPDGVPYSNAGESIPVSASATAGECPIVYTLVPDSTSVSYTSANSGSQVGVSIEPASATYSVSDDRIWITSSRNSAGNLSINVLENLEGNSREGRVTLTHSDDSSVKAIITVTQAASVDYSISTNFDQISADSDGRPFFPIGFPGFLTITTEPVDGVLAVGKLPFWITATVSGNRVFISIESNFEGSYREGFIRIEHANDSSKFVQVQVDQTGTSGDI